MQSPGFDTYISLEGNIEVEVHVIARHELSIVKDFFDVSIFKEGDYLVRWPDDRCSVVTPEIFAIKYRKKDVEEHPYQNVAKAKFDPPTDQTTSEPSESKLHFSSVADAEDFLAETMEIITHPEQAELTPEDLKKAKQNAMQARIFIEKAEKAEGLPDLGRVTWDSVDSARMFAQEMQHAIDHPEEQAENCRLSPDEVKEAKAYIRSAKEYLVANGESL